MEVPASLENAFQYLREADTSLTLWADSVCIRQDDELEKQSEQSDGLIPRLVQAGRS
jgi:hypothetical protein